MKVIFLDIDGVLTSLGSCIAYEGYPMPGATIKDGEWDKFDVTAVHLIRKLVNVTQAKVVLSSSWRHFMSDEHIANLSQYLQLEISDITSRSLVGVTRGEAIQDWLSNHPEVTHYVILDDDVDMLESQFDHLIQTSYDEGFTFHNLIGSLDVLGSSINEVI